MGLTFRGSVNLFAKHTYEMPHFSGWAKLYTGIDQFGGISAILLAALILSQPNCRFPCSSSRLKISSIGHEEDIDSVQTDER